MLLDLEKGVTYVMYGLDTFSAPSRSGPAVQIRATDTGSYAANLSFWTAENGDPLADATQRMTITTSGNVGIGTDSPATTLEVVGDISATSFIGNITGNVTGNADTATKISSITNTNIVQLDETQTLTNKTLTSPTITSPTITSPTITGTGAIAGTFTGNLTGNVTGNITATVTGTVTGSADTVTNSNQPAIKSVGSSLGIGTTSTTATLDVVGTGSFTGVVSCCYLLVLVLLLLT